ncbi:MAG: acriflavin resistance protein [Acidobacteria bacterium]|nr:acriflavin resistance protein [Acidobacteriota bacterium]
MHGLAKLCIKRPVFATMLILAFIVSGIFSYFSLGVDRMPKIDAPMVMVTVINAGASPEEVETEITKKIEDAVNSISGLDEIGSTSSEGMALIRIEFDLSKDGNVAAQEVQNKINQIVNELPSSAEVPVVSKMDLDATSVLQIAISAPRSTRDVTMIADKLIKQRLENCDGVGQVKIQGGADREIHIIVNPERLRAYNLTVTDVFMALQSQNMEMPGGSIKAGEKDFTIRTSGKIKNPADFNNVAIANRNGYTVKVSDIGQALDSSEEPTTAVRLDGEPAVQIAVYKQSGTNTVEVAEAVKERLAQVEESLPKDVRVQIISDQSIFVKAAIDNIRNHLFEGSLLAAIVLLFFLANWRTTMIAAIAIPVSIISAFSIMAIFDYTMNQITMLALTLMVGVVVDDAIIVLENIYRYMEEKRMEPFKAAEYGTKEIGLAVLATTISLLAVFIPVGFMGGMTGRFMSAFGFTCAGAVVVSMLVSFTLTPMLCSRFVHPPAENTGKKSKDTRFFRILDATYTKALVWAMGHRKTVVLSCIAVILSIIPLFLMIGKNMFVRDDQSQFNISIRLPEGSSLAETTRHSEGIARRVRGLDGVTHTLNTVGGDSSGSANESSIYVKLVDIGDRDLSSNEMATKVRDMLKDHPSNIFLSVVAAGGIGPGGMSDIQYSLQGPDIRKLAEYSDKLVAKAKTVPGLGDIDSSLRSGKPEVQLDIDRERAADLGVSVQSVQQALNTLVAGQTASTFNAGDDQYDVVVQAEDRFRGSVEGLEKLTVASTKSGSVGLNEVVRIRTSSGPSNIERLNRQRIVEITGNLLPGGSQSTAVSHLERFIDELNMGPDYRGGATGITGEMNKAGLNFAIAFALAFIFMYIALAAQFESFIHPVTILISLPLAVPFGLFSMLVTGQEISVMSGLGLLLLFGIVKKNAILQIDHTNGLRAAGMSRYDAIIQANRDRLRPILMTTMALVCGMIPLLISRGAGAATNHSIGWMVAGGQTLCLALTLLAIPVFYSLWEDLAAWLRSVRFSGWKVKRVAKAAAAALVLVIAVSVSFAQTPAQSFKLEPMEELKLEPRIGIEGETSLSLKEVIELVLDGDPELEISRISLQQAAHSAKGAEGYHDPVFTLDTSKARTVTPMASIMTSSGKLTSTDFTFSPTISGSSRWLGSSYSLSFSDSKQTNDSTFTTLNPQYASSLSLTLTQPLLRDLTIDAGRHSLLVARKNYSLSVERLRQRTIERVTQAVQYYWELIYACQNVDVQKEAVRLATNQYESNRRQAEQGLLAPIEVIAAERQVATYRQTLALAQQNLTVAENNLKQMLMGSTDSELWNKALIPETDLHLEFATPDLRDALQQAMADRPELSESLINIDMNQIDQRYYKNQAKPQINAYASVTASGLAGTEQSISPFPNFPGGGRVADTLVGDNWQSLHNLWVRNFPAFQFGVQISLPFSNHTARENAAISLAEGRKLQVQRKQMEMYVEADVRNALEQLNSSRARYDASMMAVRAASEQYESEQRQFKDSTSTMFLVLERQTSLIVARSSNIRARADLAQAIANVNRATARTLEEHQIIVQ